MQRKYIVLLGVGLVGCLALIIGSFIATRPRAYLEIQSAPDSVVIKTKSRTSEVASGDRLRFVPGSYAITASADGFEAATYTVELQEDETTKLYVSLTPQTDAARSQVDSAEARKIAEQAKDLEREKFIGLLPLKSATFEILAVPALKHPNTDRLDVFIDSKAPSGEADARAMIASLGYDIDSVLVGSNRQYTIATGSNFETKALFDPSSPRAPLLYIAPINTTTNQQRESARTSALDSLKEKGYDPERYNIYYTDQYLAKYSPVQSATPTHGAGQP